MLDDVEGADEIELAIAEGERPEPALQCDAAARIQPIDDRRADVDEMGAGNRQPPPQTGPELEPRRRVRQLLGHERPRVEAIRTLQTRLPPERVGALGNDRPYVTTRH